MEIVEAPRLSDNSAPDGALVLVTMDPVASVAALGDADATAAAERLARTTFFGYIWLPTEVNWSKPPILQPLNLRINFVMRCLPDPPHAFVPLSFDAALQHPSGRLPVLPSLPLPWPDCFLYTKDQFIVRISRVYLTDPAKICRLSQEQRRVVRHAYVYDIQHGGAKTTKPNAETAPAAVANHHATPGSARRLERVEKSKQPIVSEESLEEEDQHLTPPGDPSSGDKPSGDDSSGDNLGDVQQQKVPFTKANLVRHDERSTSSDDSVSSGDDETTSDDESEPPRELKPSAEIQLDLSCARDTRMGTVDDYYAYMRDLRAIEEDWVERNLLRKLANQPETERWAADVAAALASELGGDEGGLVDVPAASIHGEVDKVNQHQGQPTVSLKALKSDLSREMLVTKGFRRTIVSAVRRARKIIRTHMLQVGKRQLARS